MHHSLCFGFFLAIFFLFHPITVNGQSFVLNGSASYLGGDCYQLTPDAGTQAGSIFSESTIDLTQPFSLSATFFFGCKDANGADGIVFILATSNTALGAGGGGLGYQGITPSIAVEYDDYFNSNFADPVSDHVAVVSMGSVDHNLALTLVGPDDIANIEDCMEHCFYLNWDPVTQTLTSTLDDNTISYTGNITANIFGGNPSVYYGFSSGTGSLSNIHRVCFGPPQLEPMADVTICEGESADLQADPNGIYWTWQPNPTLTPLNVSDPVATPDVTTTYMVSIEYPCGYMHLDTVTVFVNPYPQITATNNGPVCEGDALALMAEGGTSYEWSGPLGYSSGNQNPVIDPFNGNQEGLYIVTVTDAAGCTSTASTFVELDPGPEITIDPLEPLCENEGPVQLLADPAGGTWAGDISPSGVFDPGYVGEGFHIISYTSVNADGCANTEEIIIEVLTIPEVTIDPAGPFCENSTPVQLSGTPPGGIWQGEVSLNGLFDPGVAGAGSHLLTYIANDGNGCSNTAEITIEVALNAEVVIMPAGPFCVSDTTVILSASLPGGIWGGVVNQMGVIHPSILGTGFFQVTYELISAEACVDTTFDIEIIEIPLVMIEPVPPLCPDTAMIPLLGTPPGGTWSGAADPAGLVHPHLLGSGLHPVYYHYNSSNGCAGTDTFDVLVFPEGPEISNLNFSCNPADQSYVVTFTISGGDPLSYSVTGSTGGNLLPGNPVIFMSDAISNGEMYQFIIDDANHCDPQEITGDHFCNCATNAGILDLNLVTGCEGDTIFILPPTGVLLEPDDSLIYVLHKGFPDSILMVSDTNYFLFGPPLQPGVIYYISTVAGNASPVTGVDLSDPCLSVSFGTPVIWQPKPHGTITAPSFICNGDSTEIEFSFSGTGPFEIQYSDGFTIHTESGLSASFSLPVQPVSSVEFTLLQVVDLSVPECASMLNESITIEVIEPKFSQQTIHLCSGDSVVLGGTYQTNAGTYFDSLSTTTGCDSIVESILQIIMPDTVRLEDTSCDPSQTGEFITYHSGTDGCDSLTITIVSYAEADTTMLSRLTCDPAEAGVFSENLTTQDGCDSLVIETVTLSLPDTTLLSSFTCIASEAGTFFETYINQAGCDSLIIEEVQLILSDTTTIFSMTCIPSEAGTFYTGFVNQSGCDSIVIETIDLIESDTLIQLNSTCDEAEVGISEDHYMNAEGCDSTVITITELLPEEECSIDTISRNVFIPNVFSPNGDNRNDYFYISASQEEVEIRFMRIYDRWGDLLLEKNNVLPNDPLQGWDGRWNGTVVNPGVYVWSVELNYPDGLVELLVGNVTLIR